MKPYTAKSVARARRLLTPLLQLDLFEDREEVAQEALAELRALERQAIEAKRPA